MESGADAPWSSLKREVIEEGMSPGQLKVAYFLDRVREEMRDQEWVVRNSKPAGAGDDWRPSGVMILDTDLVEVIKNSLYEGRHNDRLEKPATVRKIGQARGWEGSGHKAVSSEWGLKGSSARLLFSEKSNAGRLPGELKGEIRPLAAVKLAQEWGI